MVLFIYDTMLPSYFIVNWLKMSALSTISQRNKMIKIKLNTPSLFL